MVNYYYVKKTPTKKEFGEGVVLTLILLLGLCKIVLVVKNMYFCYGRQSTSILFISYYLMFGYCLNGQQLIDKVNKKSLSILTSNIRTDYSFLDTNIP